MAGCVRDVRPRSALDLSGGRTITASVAFKGGRPWNTSLGHLMVLAWLAKGGSHCRQWASAPPTNLNEVEIIK